MAINDQITQQLNNCIYLGCGVSDSQEETDEYQHTYIIITEQYCIAFIEAVNINSGVQCILENVFNQER